MIGRQLSHYRVISELGAGGMGQVYEAEDLDLRRHVALKVLPEEVAQDEERLARFRREAQALAALNHPSIVTVHSVEQAEGIQFLTMELVSGSTLDRLIPAQGMPLDQFLDLALPLAEAITAAHERGITHRDLKPANIMVTKDGRPKILDFGLAKVGRAPEESVSGEAPTEMMTQEGSILGTMPYMSPEQIQGKPVDQRSDIFALGTIFYEMLAGHRPFSGETSPDLMSAILREAPPAVDEVVPALPRHLGRILQHCLEKDPAERFQTTRDVGNELKSLRREITSGPAGAGSSPPRQRSRRRLALLVLAAALLTFIVALTLDVGGLRHRVLHPFAAPPIRSLAVLPLENLSADGSQEYLADGITEELIADIAKIGTLEVTSRTSAMHYKGTHERLPEIAKELGVDGVVEGSVAKIGGQIRVTAELIDGRTDKHIWGETYQRDLADVLSLESNLARAVADALAVQLTPQETTRLSSTQRVNPAAYEAYLKGKAEFERTTPAGLESALASYNLALKIDPDYAPAYAGIAAVWGGRQQMGMVPPSEATPRSKAAILKAIELEPNLAEAHTILANIAAWNDWDWPRAGKEFKRALELNPSDTWARGFYSHLLNLTGRHAQAMVQIRRATSLDPYNPLLQLLYGIDLIFVHRYDEAVGQFKKVLEVAPRHPVGVVALPLTLAHEGKYQEALTILVTAESTRGDKTIVEALGRGSRAGGFSGAMHAAADVLARRSQTSYVGSVRIAGYYLYADDRDKALSWLEKAYETHDPNLPYIELPTWDALRNQPRFRALLGQMKLPR